MCALAKSSILFSANSMLARHSVCSHSRRISFPEVCHGQLVRIVIQLPMVEDSPGRPETTGLYDQRVYPGHVGAGTGKNRSADAGPEAAHPRACSQKSQQPLTSFLFVDPSGVLAFLLHWPHESRYKCRPWFRPSNGMKGLCVCSIRAASRRR